VELDKPASDRFEIVCDPENYPGQFRVEGEKIESVVKVTNWDYYEAMERFQRVLYAEGITQALSKAGAREGDLVMIGEWDFSFVPQRARYITDLGLGDIAPRERVSMEED
jgi:GTP-binding protein